MEQCNFAKVRREHSQERNNSFALRGRKPDNNSDSLSPMSQSDELDLSVPRFLFIFSSVKSAVNFKS